MNKKIIAVLIILTGLLCLYNITTIRQIEYRYPVRENIEYTENSIKFELWCVTEYTDDSTDREYLDTYSFKVDNPTSMRNVFTDRQCKTTSNLYNE